MTSQSAVQNTSAKNMASPRDPHHNTSAQQVSGPSHIPNLDQEVEQPDKTPPMSNSGHAKFEFYETLSAKGWKAGSNEKWKNLKEKIDAQLLNSPKDQVKIVMSIKMKY